MRVGSLFSGVGGFDLAFERAGYEIVWCVESDPACRRVLAARFPGVRLYDDVREVHAEGECERVGLCYSPCPGCLPAVDVLVGGWPCQPFSVAGQRRGTDDERDLWPEFARLVGELRPRWMVGENVPGLLSMDEGRVWGRTVGDLHDLGHVGCWRVLDAQHFGVPQRRRRVFIVASAGNLTGPAQVLFEPEGGGGDSAPRRTPGTGSADGIARSLGGVGGGQDYGANKGSLVVSEVAQTLHATQGKNHDPDTSTLIAHTLSSEGADASEDGTGRGTPLVVPLIGTTTPAMSAGNREGCATIGVASGMAVRRLTPRECERLQGFPDDWTLIDGTSDSTRYRQLGNAVAVPVVEWIARRLLEADDAC